MSEWQRANRALGMYDDESRFDVADSRLDAIRFSANNSRSIDVNDALKATTDDVRYAYRLLLGREPDAEGWQHHSETVRKRVMGTLDVARVFMASAEYSVLNNGGGDFVWLRSTESSCSRGRAIP